MEVAALETLYLIFFIAGILYAVIAIFLGDIFNFRFGVSGGRWPFVTPATAGAFVTVLGGCGYFLSANAGLNGFTVAAISIVSAIFFASLMFFIVVLPLLRAEKSAARSAEEMIGKTAEVVTLVMDGSKGEIVYEQGGIRLSAPAKITEGQSVKQGETVKITGLVSGTFIIEKAGANQG